MDSPVLHCASIVTSQTLSLWIERSVSMPLSDTLLRDTSQWAATVACAQFFTWLVPMKSGKTAQALLLMPLSGLWLLFARTASRCPVAA